MRAREADSTTGGAYLTARPERVSDPGKPPQEGRPSGRRRPAAVRVRWLKKAVTRQPGLVAGHVQSERMEEDMHVPRSVTGRHGSRADEHARRGTCGPCRGGRSRRADLHTARAPAAAHVSSRTGGLAKASNCAGTPNTGPASASRRSRVTAMAPCSEAAARWSASPRAVPGCADRQTLLPSGNARRSLPRP